MFTHRLRKPLLLYGCLLTGLAALCIGYGILYHVPPEQTVPATTASGTFISSSSTPARTTFPPLTVTPEASPVVTLRPVATAEVKLEAGKYYLLVDIEKQLLSVYTMQEEHPDQLVRQMICSTGAEASPTPQGTYQIYSRQEWMTSFVRTYARYATRFNGHYLFHSSGSMKKTPDSIIDQCYQSLGQPVSQGCVRLCMRDAKWVYDHCKNGSVVRIAAAGGPQPIMVEPLPEKNHNVPYDPTDVEYVASRLGG